MNTKNFISLHVCFLSVLFYSCHNGGEKHSDETTIEHFGKYVYYDDNDILHIDPNCSKLRNGKDDGGHDIYAKHPIDTANFMIENSESLRVCARCVSDKDYEHLLKISENNTENNSYSVAADTIARTDFYY